MPLNVSEALKADLKAFDVTDIPGNKDYWFQRNNGDTLLHLVLGTRAKQGSSEQIEKMEERLKAMRRDPRIFIEDLAKFSAETRRTTAYLLQALDIKLLAAAAEQSGPVTDPHADLLHGAVKRLLNPASYGEGRLDKEIAAFSEKHRAELERLPKQLGTIQGTSRVVGEDTEALLSATMGNRPPPSPLENILERRHLAETGKGASRQ